MPGRRGRRTSAEPPDAEAALEVAARFLGTRPRTRWEVERRLRRAGVPDAVVTATVDRLADLGYLDDAAFVRWWLEQRDRHAPRGRRMLEAELRQRGVPREVIEEFREAY
ncbi:MAG TPA: regulatory protein RecX, partial [Candidatus Limnocylindria bacterium]|nr:regulatory protein RecX [Candidatus Limnocylindria bacterium]